MGKSMLNFTENITKSILCSTLLLISVAQTAQATTAATPWQPKGCSLKNENNNITLGTDAYLSNNKLHIRLTLKKEVQNLPNIIFNAKRNTPIYLEGSSPHYSFELPYTAHEVADLLHENSVIIIDYQLKDENTEYYETFDTTSLVPLISQIAKKCHKK